MERRLAQHDGLIVRLIVCGVDEGQRSLPGELPQATDELAFLRELRLVAAAELLPARRIVAEPFAQLVAGRDLLHPLRDARVGFLHAPWPQPIDEDPSSVVWRRRLVSTFDGDFRCGS